MISCTALAFNVADALAQQTPPVTLSIQADTTAVKVGERIKLRVSITNSSGQALVVDKASSSDGQAEAYTTVEVRDFSGKPLSRIDGQTFVKNGKSYVIPRAWTTRKGVTVGPGEDLIDFLQLSNLFDLSTPGVYTVAANVEIRVPGTGTEIKWIGAKSNTIQIAVAP